MLSGPSPPAGGVEPDAITSSIMETILSVFQVAISVVVIFLVLMHS